MRTWSPLLLFAISLSLAGCPGPAGNGDPVCGDGALQIGELCDPGITGGVGVCTSDCPAPAVCQAGRLTGSAQTCDAQCVYEPVTACQTGDGCCPAGCNSANDADCTASCGNGIIESGELCDGNCPATCFDGDACTQDLVSGSAATCDAVCSHPPTDTCAGGDGCCPASCDATTDSDCSASCGNGAIEPGETCDGACPVTCNDGIACTDDLLSGSASNCNVSCRHVPVVACQSGDGCCPAGCNSASDSDCSASCGNGVLDSGELCDGDCPLSCTDGNACTLDVLSGSAANCTAACSYQPLSQCNHGDGCCPVGCNSTVDDDCSISCGNGIVEGGETCDGDCPFDCNDQNACTLDASTGSAQNCNLSCTHATIQQCQSGDGCCPAGCTTLSDSDCSASCGNGIIESGEVCDGNCPATCDDGYVCTLDGSTGSAQNCNLTCTHTLISQCVANDGCCPAGCDQSNDNDCSATCGDAIVDPNETCDGNCPATCTDGDACTVDSLTGSAANCNAACSFVPQTLCQGGDGCCPTGCSSANDNDCVCTPQTCQGLGAECGSFWDGCSTTLACGGCLGGETCVAGTCQAATGTLGSACAVDGDCNSGACIEQGSSAWTGGYCSLTCTSDAACGAGGHCAHQVAGVGICMIGCSVDADCRTPDYGCYDADGDVVRECAPLGRGAGAVGDPCASFADCGGGQQGYCAPAAEGFKAGFCSRDCAPATPCPGGSHCAFTDGSGRGACVPDCSNDPSCRGADGYLCFDADGAGANECYPAATGVLSVGAACQNLWDCGGGRWGLCAPAPDWPGGYCTVECTTGTGTCPGGTDCVLFDPGASTEAFCLDICTGAAECRPSYRCTNVGGSASNECNPQP